MVSSGVHMVEFYLGNVLEQTVIEADGGARWLTTTVSKGCTMVLKI